MGAIRHEIRCRLRLERQKRLICAYGASRARTGDLLLANDPGAAQGPCAEGLEPGAAGTDDLVGESRSGFASGRCVIGVSLAPMSAKGGDEEEPPRSFAVMVDDLVLCAECAHEVIGDGRASSAGVMVHAWIDAGPGVCCCWCGVSGWSA
jgi:hypothetical protein